MKRALKTILLFLILQSSFIAAQIVFAETSNQQNQLPNSSDSSLEKERAKSEESQGLQTKISLNLRAMDLVDTIKFLAKETNANIVTTKNVSGRVTLTLNDVPAEDALEVIIITNGLARTQKGGIITIMTEEEYQQLYGEKYNSMRISKTVQLKYADAKRVKSMLENIKSSIGLVAIDEPTGTIVLVDTPTKIKDMEETIEKIDLPTVERIIPTVTKEFELSYAKAGEIKTEISEALTEDIGKIRIDERTNKIVVTDLAHNMKKIKQLVKAFDAKTREVFIEAKILEVTLSDDYSYGVEWEKVFSKIGDFKNVALTGAFPFSAVGSSSLGVDIGTLASDDYEVALKLIESVGKVSILSSPRITVVNNREAKFMVGSREAYVTQTVSQGDVTTTVAEDVQFIDVGVTLFVTPTINKEGFVRLDIKPEVSSVRDWLETEEGSRVPIVDTSNLETSILIKGGNTVILAGFIKETDSKSTSKVPFLGDIPLLGNAFKAHSDEYEKKELIIFLTPYITPTERQKPHHGFEVKPRKPPK